MSKPQLPGVVACRNFPIIYCNMPKAACTTIKNIMHRIDAGSFLEEPITIHSRKDLLVRPTEEPDTILGRLTSDFVFTFVRNPLKRGYSCFNEKIFSTGPYASQRGRDAIKKYGADFDGECTVERHRHNFKAFLAMVDKAEAGEEIQNPHWLSQSRVLTKWTFPHRNPDFIGRLENFNAEMGDILARAGSDFDVTTSPRMNEGDPPPFSLEEIIDDEIIETAKCVYAGDLEMFGYQL